MFSETTRIKIAKWLDEYAGRWLMRFWGTFQSLAPRHGSTKAERILFVKFWGIGSIILAEPALRYLRRKYPGAQIDFLTLAQNRELFELIPHIRQVFALNFRHLGRFLFSAIRLLTHLRRQKYDLIFDAEFFANFSTLLSSMARPSRLAGFSRPGAMKSRLLNVAVPFDDNQHAADNFLRLAKAGAGEVARAVERAFPRIHCPPMISNRWRFLHQRYVALNVNASPLAFERRWPPERFVQLAEWLLQRYETDLIFIGTQAERAYTQAVAQAVDGSGSVHNLAGALSLSELAGVIGRAALFISNDSGPLHLAAALSKPVVGFYGPETPKRFGPLNDEQLIFYLGLPCSPCMSIDNAKTVNCTNHRRCMLNLSVAMVIPRLRRFIDENTLLPKRVAQAPMIEMVSQD